MSTVRKYLLRGDEFSHFRNDKGKHDLYGKKGELVTEVSDHSEVIIVESKQGSRFPVLKKNLKTI